MVVMKMTYFEHIPDTCDNCIYYSCKPHPYKGWSDVCELCGCCMDDDQEDDWIYDGDSRPKDCPLMEIQTGTEPQTGHWIIMSGRNIKCSECGRITSTESPDTYNFCMACGVPMSEEVTYE